MNLELTLTDWVVCIGSLVLNVLLGLYFALRARRQSDSSSFFLAGRTLTWPIVGASLFATNIGAEHMVGLSGDSYRYGICAGTVELTTAICLGFAAAVLLPYYLKNKVFTIPEFLEIRYGPQARLAFSGLMLFICIVTKMAFCMYAGALVLKAVTGWGIMESVLIMGGTTAVITMIGGFGDAPRIRTLPDFSDRSASAFSCCQRRAILYVQPRSEDFLWKRKLISD